MEVESLRAWQREFKIFKGLEISGVSGFLFWAIEPIWKTQTTENLEISFQEQINVWGDVVLNRNWSCKWKKFYKFNVDKCVFRRKQSR